MLSTEPSLKSRENKFNSKGLKEFLMAPRDIRVGYREPAESHPMSNIFSPIIVRRIERFCSLQITTDARRENLRYRNF